MKKRILVILIVLIISVILKSNLTGSAVAVQSVKVEVSIMERLEEEQEVSVIVLLKDDDIKSEDRILSNLNLESSEEFKLKHKYSIINGFSGKITKKGLDKLKDNPKIAGIYLDKVKHIFLESSVPLINADDVWNLQIAGVNITGANQAVCILDTGIEYTHDSLGNCTDTSFLAGNCSKVLWGYDFVNSDNDPVDDHGHGTHMAGIVASNHETHKGVAPDAKLIAMKVCNSNGECAESDVIAAIEWCINNATKFNISAISMSFGGGSYPTYCDEDENDNDDENNDENDNDDGNNDGGTSLTDVINIAIAQNITVVAATGNNGSTTQIAAPACIKNVIAVSASDDNDAIASFSNRNNITDLLAPGVNINSTKWGGFVDDSGTSMSAPHVAGAVALLRQFFEEQNGIALTPKEIETTLKNTGKQINDSSGSNLNFSRIDVYGAVLSLDLVAPIINLTSPANNTNSTNFLQEFNFTVTDNLALNIGCNLTINGSTVNTIVTENNMLTTINYTFLKDGDYQWNVICWDKAGNTNIAETRILTINVIAPNITINSPEDFFGTSNNTIIFNATVYDSINLTNVSLFGNWSGWHLNETNLSGINNIDYIFTKDLTSYGEGIYSWYIEACDNSNNCAYSFNRTFIIDSTQPNINLISPSNASTWTSSPTVTFQYNVMDIAIANCSLIINDGVVETDTNITTNTIQSFTKDLGNGDYNCSINCVDYSGYESNSFTLQLSVNYQAPSGNGGSSPGGGSSGGRSTAKVVLCIENWQCSGWSNCSILGRKVRACTDLNKCSTVKNKPITIEPCVYVALTEEKIEEVKNVSVVEEETKSVPITGGVVRNFFLGNRMRFNLLISMIVLGLTVLAIYFLRKKSRKTRT